MPAHIIPYLTGLLQARNITATFLERQFGFSHDQVTRALQRRFHWQRIILFTIQQLFGVLSAGYLIIDDTTISKPYAKKLEGAGYVYSSVLERTVYGYQVVMLCWTNGTLSVPLSWRFYRKHLDGKTKIDLARELIEEAYVFWKLTPKAVLLDTWYSAGTLLNQLHHYGWAFVCQIKKNRVVNACRVDDDLIYDRESLIGPITGVFKGKVLKNEQRFLLTNELGMADQEMIHLYNIRWKIEEFFRFAKTELHLEELQTRSLTSYQTHLGSCVISYLILQKEQRKTQSQDTIYFIKQEWMLNRRLGRNRIRHYVKVLSA